MRVLIFLFTLFTLLSYHGQGFYKLYSGPGFDKGESVIQLPDSSYVLTGSSGSFADNNQAFLLAVDKSGNYNWSKSYGGAESDLGSRVLQVPNNGLLIAGFSNSYGQGDFDAFLIKTDLDGNEQWVKNYTVSNHWEKINDAVLTADSGVVMVGEIMPTSNGNSDVYVICTDKNGDTLWTKRYGTNGLDAAQSILSADNGAFYIAGEWFNSDSSLTKAFLIKIDQNGDTMWHKFYGNLSGRYGFMDITMGTNLIYGVGYRKINDSNFDHYITKIDLNGNLLYEFTMLDDNIFKSEIFDEIIFLSNSNRVALGYRERSSDTFQDDFDNKTCYLGASDFIWLNQSKSINNEGLDEVGQLLPTNDGAYIMIGTNTSIGLSSFTENGGSNIYLLKVGANDIFPNTSTVVNTNPLVQTLGLESKRLNFYPNPVDNYLTVESDRNFEYTIVNSNGLLIKSGSYNILDKHIDLQNLETGIYFLQIETLHIFCKLIKN